MRYIRPYIRRLLISRLVLHSARRHARRRRQIHTDTPTQFPVPVVAVADFVWTPGCTENRKKQETKETKSRNRSCKTLRRNFRFSEATGIGSVSSGGDSRFRSTTKSDESRTWVNRRRQRQCVSDNEEDPDSSCSAAGAAAVAETNIDRSPSSATYSRTAENWTPSRPQLGQLVPEGRAGGKLSSPGAGSALELPDSVEAGAESESSLCGDMSPVRRSRFDVDDTTLCTSPPSRRVEGGRRQRQSRPTQGYSTGPDRLR